jgi:hypothetical protein
MEPLRLHFILEVKKKVPILCQIRCRKLDTKAKLCVLSALHPFRIFTITFDVDLQILCVSSALHPFRIFTITFDVDLQIE